MNQQPSGFARMRSFAFALAAAVATLAITSGVDVALGNASLSEAVWLLAHFTVAFPMMYFALYQTISIVRGSKPSEPISRDDRLEPREVGRDG